MINHHFNEVVLISVFQNNSIHIKIKLSDEKVFLPFIIYEGHISNYREKLTVVNGQKLQKRLIFYIICSQIDNNFWNLNQTTDLSC